MASFKSALFGLCLLSLRLVSFVSANSPAENGESLGNNYLKKFSWEILHLWKLLGMTKEEEQRPIYYSDMNSTVEKRGDDGTLIEAVAPPQCAICPSSPEVVRHECTAHSYHSNFI